MQYLTRLSSLAASLVLCASLAGPGASANAIAFDGAWKEQGLLRLFGNDYALRGAQLGVTSDGTVSVLWRALDPAMGSSRKASWDWQVTQGVVPTDLARKGGDDRSLALYFVFVDAQTAGNLGQLTARRLLRNPDTRALVYVWGGTRDRGTIMASPYSSGLRTKILRTGTRGSFSENVDLEADFRRAFGEAPGVLVGLAVTADSDDTDGRIDAQISNLRIR